MARLILFTGHAGTGKTTLSKLAVPMLHRQTGQSFFLLDKDTVFGAYSANVMRLLTGDGDDRDSQTFLDNLREPEYNGLLDIARENLELGVNVVVCAPFSREVKSRRLFDLSALNMPAQTSLSVVWVTIDEEVARQRIIMRGHRRDAYKLAHWDMYRKRRFEPQPGEYPQLLIHDNTTHDPVRWQALVDRLSAAG